MSEKPSYEALESRIADLEQQLRQYRTAAIKYQALFENFPHGIVVTDTQGKIIETNNAAEELIGINKQDHEKRSIDGSEWRIIRPDGSEMPIDERPAVRALKENKVVANCEMGIPKSEEITWLSVTSAPIPIENHGVVITFNDISERKRAEEARRQEEKRYRRLFESHSDAIYLISNDGEILDANKSACRSLGRSKQSIVSSTIKDVDPNYDRETFKLFWSGQPEEQTRLFESTHIRADGTIFPVEVIGIPFVDDKGKRLLYGFARDITERKKARKQLQDLAATLEQRVAERTRTAELRSRQLHVLTVELIEAEERERRRIAELLHDDLQQILAAAKFQLQTFSGILPSESILFDVERLLDQSISKSRLLSYDLSPPVLVHSGLLAALKWLAKQMEAQFGLQVALEANTEPNIDYAPVKQFVFRAVQELLFNIVKHAGVRSAGILLSGSESRLVVTVRDRGRGFDPEILDAGTMPMRIGLLSVRERARHMGGDLVIESSRGEGSRLTLSIALKTTQAQKPQGVTPQTGQPAIAVRSDSPEATGTRVLFVDDHKVMRKGLINLITGNPTIQAVGEAENGREAIELARRLRPDLILMDISMPEMDGIEATRRIKAELPDVRVIGLSMHEDEHLVQNMRQAGAEALVSKTVSLSELLRTIYAVSN
jgi:PAS domain S-box-containing protein